MKQKTMVLIALAVVCGLGASFMTSKLLADRQTEEEKVKVLVARVPLSTGNIIRKPEEVFELQDMLKEKAPKNALTTFEEIKGRQMKIPRRPGDTITQDDLYSDKDNSLMHLLPPGHRAVGVRVSSEMIAAGFAAVPHSRVDIACAVRGNKDSDTGTRIVLQNVLVLASGSQTIRGDDGKPMLCDVVTVALKPEDACKLETVKGKGNLMMFLRPFGDNTTAKVGFVTVDRAFSPESGENKDPDDQSSPGKPGTGAPEGIVIPEKNHGPVKLEEQPKAPVVEKQMIRVTNGDKAENWIYGKDQDGFTTSQVEPVQQQQQIQENSQTPAAPRNGAKPAVPTGPTAEKHR